MNHQAEMEARIRVQRLFSRRTGLVGGQEELRRADEEDRAAVTLTQRHLVSLRCWLVDTHRLCAVRFMALHVRCCIRPLFHEPDRHASGPLL